jgi:hypothetical protein
MRMHSFVTSAIALDKARWATSELALQVSDEACEEHERRDTSDGKEFSER